MNRHASMNRMYRLVWSRARSAWVPVAENASGCARAGRARAGRSGSGCGTAVPAGAAVSGGAQVALLGGLVCSALLLGVRAQAGPTGGQVTSGSATITQSGSTTTVRQSSANVSLNWLGFNIAPQETVDFVQPSAASVAVNRIFGGNGTQILGHLDANGQVYLINPNGIVFGRSAEVNVGGLVASTLDLSDAGADGTRSFSGAGPGSVINEGSITAGGGYVALLGGHVSNQGLISAQLGSVALGAGSAVTLTFNGQSLVHLEVERSVLRSLAQNGGVIQADGGRVFMTAGARDAVLASVVNNTGVIEARTVQNHAGSITLLGGMSAGTVNVDGTLDAGAPDGGNGGHIETSAAHVEVAGSAKLTTAAAAGLYGSWLIDPQDFTVAASGGDITGATLSSELAGTSVTLESSKGAKAGSGNVNVNAPVSWSANTHLTLIASNNVDVNAAITATGATAGFVIDPNTANGTAAASGAGTFNLAEGAAINLPNVSSTSATALVIGGTPYTVINSLGAAGSTTGHDLQGMIGHFGGHFALGSNLDATATSTWNSGAGFTPVGYGNAPFSGVFEGLGHTISNLTINRPSQYQTGLFGSLVSVTSPALVSDVGLTGGSITGGTYVGGLVGFIGNGSVNKSYSTAAVSGGAVVGGLVGYNGGLVSGSHATGAVTGGSYAGAYGYIGGLVGKNAGTITTSYTTGAVSGSTDVGGLAGSNSGRITHSSAIGTVTGVPGLTAGEVGAVGGLVGSNSGLIDSSHASGNLLTADIATGNPRFGGLVGENLALGTISNSFANGDVQTLFGTAGGLVGTNAGAITASYATGAVAGDFVQGNGNAEVGGLVGANLATGTIGKSYATGMVSTSAVVADGSGDYVGGLVGFNAGNITNSYATGGAYGGGEMEGGLVGMNSGTITDAYSTGGVAGGFLYGGGLAGSNTGSVTHSFWDVTTSGQAASAGGLGMTTAQMQTQANFTSATAANGNVNPGWDFTNTWVMYNGHTFPLLRAFMTPLTVTATGLTKTYNGAAFSGGNGVTYSVAPAGNLFGTVSYTGSSQGAVNVGTYAITPGGLYSDQQGYIIHYVGGALTVKQLASVAWVGGTSGNWSKRSNWAGGAIPDYANVAAVTIPTGDTVTYDAAVPGTTKLTSLTSAGKLVMAAGTLSTTGNLSTAGFDQTGGTLDVGGALTVKSTSGAVSLGNLTAGALNVSSTAGAISELAGAAIDVTGASTLSADNGLTGTADKRYAVTLGNAGDKFVGAVSAKGGDVTVKDTAALTANVNATGAAALTAAGALKVSGTIGTNLTTVTTGGTGSSTTFGTTTVGNNLSAISTGAVKKASSTTALTVHGAGTGTPNSHVTVNGVVGALIN